MACTHRGLPPGHADLAVDVEEFLEAYQQIRTHVLTAYGLSAWYEQLGGIIQGGGLDPLFYVIYTIPLHKSVQHDQLGVVVQGLGKPPSHSHSRSRG